MRFWLALCCALCTLVSASHAATVESVTVYHTQGRYTLAMTVRLAVPASAAYAVMTDFEALPEVNDNVVLSQPLAGDRLHTLVHMCIAFFCREIEQTQEVTTDAPYNLRMRVVPEQSDFEYGRAQWRFQSVDAQASLLHFNAVLEPKFWIPPLIGPWLVQNKLEQQAVVTSNGIERVARQRGY